MLTVVNGIFFKTLPTYFTIFKCFCLKKNMFLDLRPSMNDVTVLKGRGLLFCDNYYRGLLHNNVTNIVRNCVTSFMDGPLPALCTFKSSIVLGNPSATELKNVKWKLSFSC